MRPLSGGCCFAWVSVGHWKSPDSFAYLALTRGPPISRGRRYLEDVNGGHLVVTVTVHYPAYWRMNGLTLNANRTHFEKHYGGLGCLVLLDTDTVRRTGLGEEGQGTKRPFCWWSRTLLWSEKVTCPVICYWSLQGSPVGAPPAALSEEVQPVTGPLTFWSPSVVATSPRGRLKAYGEEIEVMLYYYFGFIMGNQGIECRGSKLNLVKTTMDTTSTPIRNDY